LRAGRIGEADALNIAEELDDVGNEQYDKLESALRVILVHLLKWDHQSQRRSRSWYASIKVQRNRVLKILRKNPGLKPLIGDAIADAYPDARIEAGAQTRRGEKILPGGLPVHAERDYGEANRLARRMSLFLRVTLVVPPEKQLPLCKRMH
jgi:hypothetical protein